MDLLGGHPLAMRAVLPQLEKISAAEVLEAVRSNLSLKFGEDQDQAKLYATLAFVEGSLPHELLPLLALIGMHEGFVDADFLEAMAKQVDSGWTRPKINTLLQALVVAGLLQDIGQTIFEMHPLLTSYLRLPHLKNALTENRDQWARAFVDVMARLADTLVTRQLHDQRGPFRVHGQNFHYALAEAERLGMSTEAQALTQSLAAFAQNRRNFTEATRLFERLVIATKSSGNEEVEAAAYHQLGRIAEEQRDFPAAGEWYGKSLAINERLGNEPTAPAPITNWEGSPKSSGTSVRRRSGITSRWPLRNGWATSTALPSPITNWEGSPQSSGTSVRRRSGMASRWPSRNGWATSTALPSPITNWEGSPRSSGTSVRRASGMASR